MSMVLSCPACAAEVRADALACPHCHAALHAGDATRLSDADETRLASNSDSSSSGRSSRQTNASTTGWLSTSGSIDHGRFVPGTLLGGRYRTVGRLGKGGMGEVYRADDLKLGQPVALKFLPASVDHDPARLSQLHTEVRMARQVSHPNVCRVYDIDEVDGHTFLSMEYVDGEDLASILRRFGRFPEERGLEIARQICAGLAAAHERGVIHRDFKPANVMLDGAGRVRITDFGLAGVTGEALRAGTPAYMAPEQLAGGEVTARSDIYALGLVLYELFTGQRALDAKNLAELIRRRAEAEIAPPSSIVRDLSPEIDRAVMRCLAPEPEARPASALAVAAALPGGDPLAAALAAGETPSPEMVAASGEEGVLSRRAGVALLSFIVATLLTGAWVSDRRLLVGRVALDTPVEVLEMRARETLRAAGHAAPVADTAHDVLINTDVNAWIARSTRPGRWAPLEDGRLPALRYWYRTSPRDMIPLARRWNVGIADPPLVLTGMAALTLDDRGRLMEFLAVPPQRDIAAEAPDRAADWTPLFSAAGLSMDAFAPATPEWTPPVYADARYAWEGAHPTVPDLPLRVEAAAYRGQPVSFQVVWPWTRPTPMEQPAMDVVGRALSVIGTLFVLAVIVGAVALVRHNLKSGRADSRGAARVAGVLIVVWFVAWALGTQHSMSLQAEFTRFFSFVAVALMNTGTTWLFYLALEPYVRRYWPNLLVSWSRLLAGQFRDPRISRDILAGLAAGAFLNLARLGYPSLPVLFGDAPDAALAHSNPVFLLGARFTVSAVLATIPNALQIAMAGAFVFVILRALFGRIWPATVVMYLIFAIVIVAESGLGHGALLLVPVVAIVTPVLFVFLRFGLISLITVLVVNQMLSNSALTTDLTQSHAATGVWTLIALLAVAGWAFHTSRAGRGLFGGVGATPR
jgi:tRNA A-37 threonylcarbamoyl transferase component Bud32